MNDWLAMEAEFAANNVAKPTTLCWPVYAVNRGIYPDLGANGYTFGRGGHERPYRPTFDHPFDVPSFTIHDRVSYDSFVRDAQRATKGRIVVFTFHGVPEGEHPQVSLSSATFTRMMHYLRHNEYNVISLRDLAKYVDAAKAAKFLPFPNRLPWGGMQREGHRLFVSVSKVPASRKVTLPGMTTRISAVYFLEDPAKHPLKITRADTGIQTVELPDSPFVLTGDFPSVILAELQGGPIATLLDFGFPGAPEGIITGDEIRVEVPLSSDVSRLAPIYNTGSARVTGKPAPGIANDFRRPQTYTITAPDGSTRDYTVTVASTLGAVAITNPSFEQFDSQGDDDGSLERNPTGASWTFGKREGELGIRDLVDAPSAPPPLDGTRHAVFIRGPGNGISQSITFDSGKYTVSLDVVKRTGYEKSAAPLLVTLDGSIVFSLQSTQITEKWASYTSPGFHVTAGLHSFGVVLGEGDGMDIIDNVRIRYHD